MSCVFVLVIVSKRLGTSKEVQKSTQINTGMSKTGLTFVNIETWIFIMLEMSDVTDFYKILQFHLKSNVASLPTTGFCFQTVMCFCGLSMIRIGFGRGNARLTFPNMQHVWNSSFNHIILGDLPKTTLAPSRLPLAYDRFHFVLLEDSQRPVFCMQRTSLKDVP